MRIRLLRKETTARSSTLIDRRLDGSGEEEGAFTLGESDDLIFRLYPEDSTPLTARLRVGNVIVASSDPVDRPDFHITVKEWNQDGTPSSFGCDDRFLANWVGQTDLSIELRENSEWRTIFKISRVWVTAGKIKQEEFESLCREIADHSGAVLLDVYGKTFTGLRLERSRGETAPVAVLKRVKEVIGQLGRALRDIARRPAFRLQPRRVREPAWAGQGVSEQTLEEVCIDPTLAVALPGGRVALREHVREIGAPSFDLPENRILAGFLCFLMRQLSDLRRRMRAEVDYRQGLHTFHHRPQIGGDKTWWEREDLPRIKELGRLLEVLPAMERELSGLKRHGFLPNSTVLSEPPRSTPLFRTHPAYASAFRVMDSHFRAFRVELDEAYFLTRAKSLWLLYEWWCALQVLRALQSCVRLIGPASCRSPFCRKREERDRFLIEFAADQAVDFEDGNGRSVRLRYGPSYRSERSGSGALYGHLGSGDLRLPDIALEIADDSVGGTPSLIVVLDAKYRTKPHKDLIGDIREKYARIGVFKTGKELSRQVWALAPTPPGQAAGTDLASYCTVDNAAFWSDQFDMAASSVTGVVQARPSLSGGRSPLEMLLRLILRRAGIAFTAS